MTQSALSEFSKIPGARLSHYETGRHAPDDETAASLASTLMVPVQFFFRSPRDEHTDRSVFWRSKMSAKMIERHRVQRRFDWFLDVQRFIDDNIELPFLSLPVLKRYNDLDRITNEHIESVADAIREHWGLGRGPITNLIAVLEANGVLTSVQSMNDEYLDAFSEWQEDLGRPAIFLGAEKMSYARRLFSAAHELGHMLLHRDFGSEVVVNKTKLKTIEKQADYFASCLLMPAESFASDVYSASLDSLRSLKHNWLVSIQAMVERLWQLNIIGDDGRRRAYIQITRRGWRKSEPGDEIINYDLPRLTQSAFRVLKDSGVFSPDAIERQVGLTTTDIESVCGLTPGFLRDEPDNPYQLRLVH